MATESSEAARIRSTKVLLANFANHMDVGTQCELQGAALERAVVDLLCSLMQYAHHQNVDVGGVLLQACGLFTFELLRENQES